MHDIVKVHKIPEANQYQCGTFVMHSLPEAKAIAEKIIADGIGVMSNEAIQLDLAKLE